MQVEISVESLDGARVAARAGADRIELCAALTLGGLTPSAALIEQTVALGVPVHVLIRTRPGGFVYARDEIAVMLGDIRAALSLGATGVVVGALDEFGDVDLPACTAFVEAAAGAEVTFHRAVDVSADLHRTLDHAVQLGFTRILTSGGSRSVLDGAPTIRALHERAAGAIAVMACGGVRAANALQVLASTGVSHLHAAPLRPVADHHETDAAEVTALLALRSRAGNETFERRLREWSDGHADRLSATWHLQPQGVSCVSFSPRRPDACAFSIAWSAHEIVVGLDETGRIELGPAEHDDALAIAIAQAVLGGRAFKNTRLDQIWILLDDDTWIGTGGRRPPPADTMRRYPRY